MRAGCRSRRGHVSSAQPAEEAIQSRQGSYLTTEIQNICTKKSFQKWLMIHRSLPPSSHLNSLFTYALSWTISKWLAYEGIHSSLVHSIALYVHTYLGIFFKFTFYCIDKCSDRKIEVYLLLMTVNKLKLILYGRKRLFNYRMLPFSSLPTGWI